MKPTEKTNVMRILDGKGVSYTPHAYESKGALSGVEAAVSMGEDPEKVFKTLVTVGASKNHYVFVIPSDKELNLKKAAKAVSEKSIEMIKQKELLPLTGYVHGGCSPIGMKKQFKTVFHQSILDNETIIFSAGKIGRQVEISPEELSKVLDYTVAELCG